MRLCIEPWAKLLGKPAKPRTSESTWTQEETTGKTHQPDCSRTARENFLPEACESGALGLESFDGILAFEASLSKKGKGKAVILLTSVRLLLLLWCCIWALELEFEVVRLACRLL